MNPIVMAIDVGSVALSPQEWALNLLRGNETTTGWEFLCRKYAKHFGFGLEVRGSAPDFNSPRVIRNAARDAVQLAVAHYGDILVDASVQLVERPIEQVDNIRTGYGVDFDLPWDYSRPVLIQVTWDRASSSYRIMGAVYDHIIDGVPLALLVYLIHNHLLLGEHSFLSNLEGSGEGPRKKRKPSIAPGKESWMEVAGTGEAVLMPVGAQIDVTESDVVKLRKRIVGDTGCKVSTSSLELILLSMETGMRWVTDYIARSSQDPRGLITPQTAYDGLGILRMELPDGIAETSAQEKYDWICDTLPGASKEMELEREGKGWSSRFYNRYRKIPLPFVNLFDRRLSYSNVMAVAGTQAIGSNLNGVDFEVPIFTPGVGPEDVRLFFVPSHGEHGMRTREKRAERSLETHVTEISLACAPRVTAKDGSSTVYKSLKIAPMRAAGLLRQWGHPVGEISGLSDEEKVEQVFIESYRPDAPSAGRIERLARELLYTGHALESSPVGRI